MGQKNAVILWNGGLKLREKKAMQLFVDKHYAPVGTLLYKVS